MEQGTKKPPASKQIAKIDLRAVAAERAYTTKRQLDIFKNILGYSALLLVAILFAMMLAGPRFTHVLEKFGLQPLFNKETGVYADCSDPSNRDNSICERSSGRNDQSWRSMQRGGKGAQPFRLDGR